MSDLTMELTVQTLTTSEAFEKVRELAREIWPPTFSSILSDAQIEYMLDMMYAPEVFLEEQARGIIWELILNADGQAIGYVSWDCNANDAGKLHEIYLRLQYHGLGLGSKILQYVKNRCRQLGCQTLQLNVNKQNWKAIRSYRKNGFQIIESATNDIGNDFVMDDFIMRCDLTCEQQIPRGINPSKQQPET